MWKNWKITRNNKKGEHTPLQISSTIPYFEACISEKKATQKNFTLEKLKLQTNKRKREREEKLETTNGNGRMCYQPNTVSTKHETFLFLRG